MNASKRPISILILACLYIAVGVIALAYHFHELLPLQRDSIWIVLTEFLAILAGAFMLRGKNWARWLALAWMAFHVILSATGPVRELVIHSLIFAGIAWLLFRADARQYFRNARIEPE